MMSELQQPAQLADAAAAGSPITARSLVKVLTLLTQHPDGVHASDVARSVLGVLTTLAEHPDGVRAGDVADAIGKRTSTAYYLLAGLCEEGLAVRDGVSGRYRLRRERVPEPGDPRSDALEPAVDALFRSTRKHCYLGRLEGGRLEIVASRGRERVPEIPELTSHAADGMHALAMGKVVLALMPDDARRRYVQRGLRCFTDATVTSPAALHDELEQIRRSGVAVDRDEFEPDFCCVAAPMRDRHGRFVATVGLSAKTRVFDAERGRLVEAVLDAAAMSQPLERIHALLRREALIA